MRKWLAYAIAALSLIAVPAIAVELSPLVGIFNSDNVTLYPGLLAYPTGAFHPMGVLYSLPAPVAGVAGTGSQVLGTYSLPANALDAAGRRLRITAVWHHAANTNACTSVLAFGAATISTGSITASGVNGIFRLDVSKTGANTQTVTGSGYTATTVVTPTVTAATETDTAAITIAASATGGTSGADCTLSDMFVEYMN